MSSEKLSTTADAIIVDVEEKHQLAERTMTKKNESTWNGQLISIEHSTDHMPGAWPCKSQPYRAGPKKVTLERREIQKHLEAEEIEPVQSAQSAPDLLAYETEGKLRFCAE